MNHKLITFPNLFELSKFAAKRIRTSSSQRKLFSIALSGGSTPKALYSMLAKEPFRSAIKWDSFHFFWSDERCVPPEDPTSNFRMAWESLLSQILPAPSNIHRMRGEDPEPERAASDYESEIRNFFHNPDQIPPVDLILLGMGEDGHVASLFPYSPALQVKNRLIVVNFVEHLAQPRLTFTSTLIQTASCVMVIIAGPSKARTLKEILEGPYDPDRLPAQLLRSCTGELMYLVDEEAASELSPYFFSIK